MNRVCSWCHKSLGSIDSDVHSEGVVTHGICQDCLDDIFSKSSLDFTLFLNSISAPVAIVDKNGVFQSANDLAQSLLNKDRSEIIHKMSGEAFSCKNASLPGGCGKTIHCAECELRNTIIETYEHNKDQVDIPVTLIQEKESQREMFHFLVSTQKINDLVLMKIDELYL
ncbi:MAG: PAS domain-containing protein [Candidatus Marinimicrobia bacterium]|nr:PAS domain-containing protein [Candidatus Neomarinimicrobiota bacterium]